MKFYICLPAWGERHVAFARDYILPCIKAAQEYYPSAELEYLIFTDQPGEFGELREAVKEVVPPDNYNHRHHLLTQCHREALEKTPLGCVAVMLDGDITFSRELFEFGHGALGNKKVIGSFGMRVLHQQDKEPLPIGASARELLDWGWRNRHEITEACVFGRGLNCFPNTFFFDKGADVVVHTYHIHPFMILKDRRQLRFDSITIDDNLLINYNAAEIYYLENAEVGFIEVSPDGFNRMHYTHGPVFSVESSKQFATIMREAQFRNVRHQIRIRGYGKVDSGPTIEQILATVYPRLKPKVRPRPRPAIHRGLRVRV